MERDTAVAILDKAQAGGYFEGAMPLTDELLIEKGEYFFDEAKKAQETGMDDDVVLSIIRLGEGKEEASEPLPEASSPPPPVPQANIVTNGLKPHAIVPASARLSVTDTVDEFIRKENLPVPPHIEGEPRDMPRDLTLLKDVDVRMYSSEYQAYLSRVTWLAAVEASDLANAEHMFDHHFAAALRELDPLDPNTDKPKLKAVLEAEAAEDGEAQGWSENVRYHQRRLIRWKALKEIYTGHIDRLSREATLRHNEWERSR